MKFTIVIALTTLPALGALAEVSTGLDLARFSPAVLARDPRTLCHTWDAARGPQFGVLAVMPAGASTRKAHKACVPSACLLSSRADSAQSATLSLVLASQPASDATAPYLGATLTLLQLP